MRIWSLLPSATEILFALGLGEQVTGVTHECDHPPEATRRPRVTRSFVDSARPSGEIDRQVVARMHSGLQLYGIDQERLLVDPPDVIVTQDLCPVCAVSPSDFAAHLEQAACRARTVSLNPNTLDDVLDCVRQVAEATARQAEAERLLAALHMRLDRVRSAVAGAERPRVLCLEWLDRPMPAGHWLPEMVETAGGRDSGLIAPGRPSRKMPWAEMRAVEPEVIVLMPCGFDAGRAARESALLGELEGWQEMTAVAKGRVYAVDGNAYFSRPGPRVVDGVELLARILHPDRWTQPAPPGAVLKLVSAPAGASSVENWPPRFEAYL